MGLSVWRCKKTPSPWWQGAFCVKTNICFPEEMKQGDVILYHPARHYTGFVPLPNFYNFNVMPQGIFEWRSLFRITWKQKVGTMLFLLPKSTNFSEICTLCLRCGEQERHFALQTNFSYYSFNKYKISKKIHQSDTQPPFPSQSKSVLFWHSNHPHPLHYQFLAS